MILFPPPCIEYSYKENLFLNEFVKSHSSIITTKIQKPDKKFIFGVKKTGPIYAMHRYWTKQPIEVIKEYIDYFCPPGGLVLDPFCGSGTTGTAALLSNRAVILCDLSKIGTFISKNYTEKTNIAEIQSTVEYIFQQLSPIIKRYYATICESCNKKAEIKDWIYSEVFKCTVCSSLINFIDEKSTWDEILKQKHKKKVFCPGCDKSKPKENLFFDHFKPLGLRYHCKPCKLRKKFKILDNSDRNMLLDPELNNIYEITPFVDLPNGVNTNQAISKKISKTNEFFTPITLFVLSKLWNIIINIKDLVIKSKLQFIFTSILYRVTRMYRLRVNGQGGILSGTLYVPSLSQDINVWDVFLERFKKISKGWIKLNKDLPKNYMNKRLISTQSATHLTSIPSESIDYIYTDPPYGGNINYSELNLIWESWFGTQTNTLNEVIINVIGQNKSIKEYELLLQQSFDELFRILKKGHWCTIVFNSSTPKLWVTIQDIIIRSGFILAKEISQIESNMTTAKQTQSKKTARRYMLINLQKPLDSKPNFSSNTLARNQNRSKISLKKELISEITNFLKSKNSNQASYDLIYDELITNLLPTLKIHDFDLKFILQSHFVDLGSDIWTLNSKIPRN